MVDFYFFTRIKKFISEIMRILPALISALLITVNMPDKQSPHDKLEPDGTDQKPVFSFGLVADIQYCECEPAGTRYYSLSLFKLREALSSLRKDNPGFVINLGDMIEKGFESYKPVMNILDSSGLKIYHLTGNHDYSVEPGEKKKIPVLQQSKTGYYSFNVGNYRFIALNGNEVSTYSSGNKKNTDRAAALIDKLKSEGKPNGMEWNGGIGPAQMKWLDLQLDKAKEKNEFVFILCHFPAWPENVHNLLNYSEVLSVLEKYDNIIAWFNGHNHQGNYGSFNKIHFVTIMGMVETETTGSHAIVEVYNDKIVIKGFGREKSLILAI